MARIAYIRVSTEEQNTARQDSMMDKQNVDKTFTEKVSGKNTARPELQRMLEYIREGDVVIVESYSRLARSTKDLLTLVEQIHGKGADFVSLKENVDTSTPQGKLMMTIFAGLAQFEREQLLQRQKEGIAEAKKRGAYKGRKPITIDKDKWKEETSAWRAGKQSAVVTMQHLGLKPRTFYNRVKAEECDSGG